MAIPRVFISSTYYDLRQVRNNISDFIRNLGYEPIIHEQAKVAYTQNRPLEEDCYREIQGCEIVICIIGNHFGSSSSENDLSITMNELDSAIKYKKKIYIFISHDVFVENKTYLQNKDHDFKPAHVDNIKIHEYIADLQEKVKNHVIVSFETTDQIISTLRDQFAGLFQNLLAREAATTEMKTAYDLQEAAEKIKAQIDDFEVYKNDFFSRFNSTLLMTNRVIYRIKQKLGLKKSAFFAENLVALDEIMNKFGYEIIDDDEPDIARTYIKNEGRTKKILSLTRAMFNEDFTFIDVYSTKQLDEGVIYSEKELPPLSDFDDGDIPF